MVKQTSEIVVVICTKFGIETKLPEIVIFSDATFKKTKIKSGGGGSFF